MSTSEPNTVDIEGLVKALEKVLGLRLTGHQYLLARDVVWAFTDGRSARCISASPPPPAPSRKRPPDFREPSRCKCPPDPAAAAVAGIQRSLDTLAECDRQEAELVRGMMHNVAALCGLPTKGGQ